MTPYNFYSQTTGEGERLPAVFISTSLHSPIFFFLQVRQCRDAVRCLLGEQLLGHVGLHPLCFLRLYLPPLPPHHRLLPAERRRLWLKLQQVNRPFKGPFKLDTAQMTF